MRPRQASAAPALCQNKGVTVSGNLLRLSVSLTLAWPAAQAAAPSPSGIAISFTEQPARLARDTSLYRAGTGVLLRAQDMLDSAKGSLQLDARDATLALGPATRIFLAGAREFVLLDGWLKIRCAPGRAVRLVTPGLALSCEGATLTMQASPTATRLFAEAGTVSIQERGEGKRRRLSLAQEHFATTNTAQTLRIAGTAPASFIAAMPPGFRDQLVALAPGAATLPQRERAATFAELASWVSGQPRLRQQLRRRFDPPAPARATPAQPSVFKH